MIRFKNAIKRGQVWQKKDTGQLIVIKNKCGACGWTTMRLNRGSSKNKSHKITEYDLGRFYCLVS